MLQDAILRAEIAERETLTLHGTVATLTQQLAGADSASCGSCDDADKPTRHGMHTDEPTLAPPSRWLLSAQTASDTPGPGSAALLTDDPVRRSAALLSRESMDAKSLKSDGLMGDEVEGLMSGASAAARGGGRGGAMAALMTQPAPAAQSSGNSSPSKASKDSPGKGKDMLRSCAPLPPASRRVSTAQGTPHQCRVVRTCTGRGHAKFTVPLHTRRCAGPS